MSEAEDFIAHFGVRGMRWGVRKNRSSDSSDSKSADSKSAESKTPKPNLGPNVVKVRIKPGKNIKTSGGKKLTPSEDAILAAVRSQIVKKSGHQALSNKDLKDLTTRLNLEQQYSRLSSEPYKAPKSAGKKFIEKEVPKMIKKYGPDIADWVKGDYSSAAQKAAAVVKP
jgi:hypothetical protein